MLLAAEFTGSDALPGLVGLVVGWGLSAPAIVHYARKWSAEARADRLLKVADVEEIRRTSAAEVEAIRTAAAAATEKLAEDRRDWHERRNEIQRQWGTEQVASLEQILALKGQVATATSQADKLLSLYHGCLEREATMRERMARIEAQQENAVKAVDELRTEVAMTPRRKTDATEGLDAGAG